MHFFYKAKKGPTEIVQGEIDAENEDAALGKIAALGLVPIKLEPGRSGGVSPSRPRSKEPPREIELSDLQASRLRIKHRDLNVFTRQFAILIKASVPPLRIFEILQTQTRNPKFRTVLKNIQNLLRDGLSLSESLGHYPGIFNQVYLNMVQTGEVSGTLDQVLERLAQFTEAEAEVRSKIQGAMVYPAFLLCVGLVTVFVLLTFVMPRLISLFADLGTELPLITRMIIQISHFFQSYWVVIGVAAAALGVFLRTVGLTENQKKALDSFLFRLPVFGGLIEKAETAKFLRCLELLYEHGIPLYKAVEVATRTVSNRLIREGLAGVPASLEGGSTLAASLREVPYFSEFVSHMVSVGEESGQLGSAVRETALFYEQEANQFIKMATSLIEPAMILIMGLVIGAIVIGMLLPIFEIHVLAQ